MMLSFDNDYGTYATAGIWFRKIGDVDLATLLTNNNAMVYDWIQKKINGWIDVQEFFKVAMINL